MNNSIVKYFYRVHVQLDERDEIDQAHLSFDFPTMPSAGDFAVMAFNACDIVKVWIEIIENEIDTVLSPMWRL